MKCVLCGNSTFDDKSYFSGTTEVCRNQLFKYGRCNKCGSINNISFKRVSHENYSSGKKKFRLRTLRFLSFLVAIGISKYKKILDYGCGSGIFAESLKEQGLSVDCYEPYNKKFNKLKKNKYPVVSLIQVFEHITNFNELFSNLNKITDVGSKVITIHPSSTRISKLDSDNILQCWTIHAPYHSVLPSDDITIDMFENNGYRLLLHVPYDIQRSGLIENNNVSALLRCKFGGTREGLINASKMDRIWAYITSPIQFIDKSFIHTKDYSVSTFVFERIK